MSNGEFINYFIYNYIYYQMKFENIKFKYKVQLKFNCLSRLLTIKSTIIGIEKQQ